MYDQLQSIENIPVLDHNDHSFGISTGNQLVVSWISPKSHLLTNELSLSPLMAVVDPNDGTNQEKKRPLLIYHDIV